MGNWDIDFNEITSTLKEILSSKWSWRRSNDYKYITVKVDMRDGGCVLENRFGQKITLEDLKHQLELNKDKDPQVTEGL